MIDPFGRVTYLRVSVTDTAISAALLHVGHMTFLPRRISAQELDRLCTAFVAGGVRKLRITGGEPLVRKNLWLFRALAPPRWRRPRRADADVQRQPAAKFAQG